MEKISGKNSKIIKKSKRHPIENLIGIAKGLPPFVRDHGSCD